MALFPRPSSYSMIAAPLVPLCGRAGARGPAPRARARRAPGRIVAVGERHTPGGRHPENGLVAVDTRTGEVAWLLRGHDFVASPTLSPDGRRLAFVAWEHPTMPWDDAALYFWTTRGASRSST